MARLAGWLEAALLLGGSALLALWASALLHRHLLAASDRARFELPRPRMESPVEPRGWLEPIVDTTDWSVKRLAAYLEARTPIATERLALLEVPAIGLEVVVLEGTDEWTLNRGVGRIEGTAALGQAGNVGIAGHRDGFFRALERVREGDRVHLTRLGAPEGSVYQIEWIRVVRPDEVWVLAATDRPSLTLVTCHPFRFVGNAPDRYVVRAVALP
jgi:sortase A